MATTAIALFTRDLRVHDNPVLAGAAEAERVVPAFVLDESVLAGPFNRPNRVSFLVDCLHDLRRSLQDLGGELAVRQGDPATEVARLAAEADASEVHVSRDVSAHAGARERRLRKALEEQGCSLHVHDAVITAQPPGELQPSGSDHFAVFTPYFRRWAEHPMRARLGSPTALRCPDVSAGDIPAQTELCKGDTSPRLPIGGERAGRKLMHRWLNGRVPGYADGHDDLAGDATSRLSPYLHFGCVSPVELIERCGHSQAERDFVRQLAWRDFHHQVLAARPRSSRRDYRTQHDRWRQDSDAWEAWRTGRTGIPIVDAGMRQLQQEGWMHNRARLITASFLTKTLYLDWRLGAQHFLDLLVDGDIANNNLNWQWVAGTGTDTRPNRVLNPVRQAQRYDPDATFIRRYLPELADLPTRDLLEPHRLDPDQIRERDYPPPVVDIDEANARFRAARGKA